MVVKCSIISIVIERLYKLYLDMLSILSFHIRPKIYTLVTWMRLEDNVYVRWSIEGLFNMEEEGDSEINSSPFCILSLHVVHNSLGIILLIDTHLCTFFKDDGPKWEFRNLTPFRCSV